MNVKDTFTNKLYAFFNVASYIVFANMLMFFVSIFGLVIFTFMPALVALYIMINSLYFKSNYPIVKSFFKIFKKEYIRSQRIFMALLIMGLIIGFDIYFFYTKIDGSFINLILMWLFIFLALVYALT